MLVSANQKPSMKKEAPETPEEDAHDVTWSPSPRWSTTPLPRHEAVPRWPSVRTPGTRTARQARRPKEKRSHEALLPTRGSCGSAPARAFSPSRRALDVARPHMDEVPCRPVAPTSLVFRRVRHPHVGVSTVAAQRFERAPKRLLSGRVNHDFVADVHDTHACTASDRCQRARRHLAARRRRLGRVFLAYDRRLLCEARSEGGEGRLGPRRTSVLSS